MPSPSRYYSSTAAKTTLSSAIDSGSTSLQLAAASGLPSQYPYTLILEKDTANEEIVEVTGLIGNAYQITRNIDNSGAKAHSIGALVEHGVSARDFSESRTHEVATTAHGVTGDIVGTTGAQTITGKTLTTTTLGSDLAAGGYKITGLATPTSSSDAATKSYIDTQTTSAAASASSAAVSASSAATSASSALTSQTSAAVSASSAATSATAAATSASSAATSATAAATSAASALTSQTAAATSAASALTSQTAAATSATSAANSATAAATSATNAQAYELSANNWATKTSGPVAGGEYSAKYHAQAAATSAASAATSASSALTSQTSAATSATSAAASATAAAVSAASAAASVSVSVPLSTVTTKGDLIAGTGAGAVTRLGAGTNGYILSADNTQASGLAWIAANPGDITSVTAGTGLSGGGTSGDVTVSLNTSSVYVIPSQTGNSGKYLTTNGTTSSWASTVVPADYSAKGVILVGTAAGTYTAQTVGTNGQVLTANSAQADGVEWTTINALPSQTGNSGKYLTTDGTSASWATVTTDPTADIFMMMGA